MIWCVDCITVVSGSYHTAHTAAALTDLYSDPRPDHLLLSCSVLQLCARTKIVSVLDLTTMSGVFIKEEVKDADEAGALDGGVARRVAGEVDMSLDQVGAE